MKRGARVFEVTENPYSIKTWVRAEGGGKEVTTSPDYRTKATGSALSQALDFMFYGSFDRYK